MQQRVIIAMAIACGPKLLIADEPTTALDVTIQAQILDLLRRMQDELHLGLVLISHSMGVIAEMCSRALVMYAGQVIENAQIVPLFESPKHPYTEALLAAVPRLEDSTGSLASIGGSPPVPWAMPRGCRFQPRCGYALDSCSERPIELTVAGEDHLTRCRRADELYTGRVANG
jgi:oligopeptide/dipeptide ABC transporter ATP-binding protein